MCFNTKLLFAVVIILCHSLGKCADRLGRKAPRSKFLPELESSPPRLSSEWRGLFTDEQYVNLGQQQRSYYGVRGELRKVKNRLDKKWYYHPSIESNGDFLKRVRADQKQSYMSNRSDILKRRREKSQLQERLGDPARAYDVNSSERHKRLVYRHRLADSKKKRSDGVSGNRANENRGTSRPLLPDLNEKAEGASQD